MSAMPTPSLDMTKLRGAPAVFRTAARLLFENWGHGDLQLVLPNGDALVRHGAGPGPVTHQGVAIGQDQLQIAVAPVLKQEPRPRGVPHGGAAPV